MFHMIRSMTGFGSASSTKGDLSATVELKSVNYRFKEVNARLPRPLLYVEDKLKQMILQHIQRGRVELFLTVNSDALIKRSLKIDWIVEPYRAYKRERETEGTAE